MFKRILAALLAFVAMSVFAAVDANTASQTDLDGIKGIGPAIAGHIVEARKAGAFKDWSDFIERVKGVGEHNAAKFSEAGLTVNGAAFKGLPAKAAAKPAATPAPAAKPATAATAATAAAPAARTEPAKVEAKADAKADAKAAKEAARKEKAEKAEAAKKEKAEKAEAKKKEQEAKAAAKAASAAKK